MPAKRRAACTVVDHPVVRAKVSILRDRSTPPEKFRLTVKELGVLVGYEALRDVALEKIAVETPLAAAAGHRLRRQIIVAPILRAGLGIADGLLSLFPDAGVAHVGMYRDERTLEPKSYYFKAPPDLSAAEVLLVDPMLATGHSAIAAASQLKAKGARRLRLVCLVGCRQGAAAFHAAHPEIPIFLAALDSALNAKGYIVPGLGDAGDRYFGT